jgi:putative membrane protein
MWPSHLASKRMIVRDRPNALLLFFALRGSILPRIIWALVACTGLAVVVTLAHGVLFHWKITLTPVPFTLIGLALSLFLGFRNAAAYERFWEARKLWGEVIHRSRTYAREVRAYVGSPSSISLAQDEDEKNAIHRLVAFAHALRCQLRNLPSDDSACRWLAPDEAAAFKASRNRCEFLLRRSAEDLGRWHRTRDVPAPIIAEMDRSLASLAEAQAGCERIASTPIPFAYTLLLHRTAYLYCFLLPFGLVDVAGVMTPVVVAIVAYTFFGLDALGDEIERPFGTRPHHLPLDALCRTIEISLLETSRESDLPPAMEPVNAVLL